MVNVHTGKACQAFTIFLTFYMMTCFDLDKMQKDLVIVVMFSLVAQ